MSQIKTFVYRIQAEDGRGPWRPGFSKYWVDQESHIPLKADVITAFGLEWRQEIPKQWHAGCGCLSEDTLWEWFTLLERARLSAMRYFPVKIRADKIIRQNSDQVIFACKKPLSKCSTKINWRRA